MQRGFIGSLGKLVGVLTAVALVLLARAPIVEAISEAEQSFLAMYFTEEELHVVSATRSLQSIERIAENVEVVTADDIELMNAHTLADVLSTVSGVQVNNFGSFGSQATPDIQGAGSPRVAVLMDGVPLNLLVETNAEIGFIPVQDIERIEIVKGPASAAWGSALGGVINVITRGPGSAPFQGGGYGSYGTKNTADYRAAVSGRIGSLGYYLSGSGLRTDGLTEGFDRDSSYLGTRLTYALAEHADLSFHLFYGDASRGDGNSPPDDLLFENHHKKLVSNLALTAGVGSQGRIDLSVWTTRFDNSFALKLISDGTEIAKSTLDEDRTGASTSFSWNQGIQNIVLGADYSGGKTRSSDLPGETAELQQWAVFANDTITLGRWSIAPGIRYDNHSISDDFLSPSLGMTYALGRNALLRATAARGFHLPSPALTSTSSDITKYQANPDLGVEKVWSYQAGFEANVLDGVWVKLSAFRHDLEDVIKDVALPENPDGFTYVNKGRQRRQGLELSARTMPFCNFTLAGAAFFMKTEDLETHENVLDIPRRVFDLSLKYDDERSFRALLKGRYYYAVEPEVYNADLGGFIFDLNLIKKLVSGSRASLEAFASVHNLFNGNQYWADIYKNAGRWYEGGVRVGF